jgi:putative effector of murein hydrolase
MPIIILFGMLLYQIRKEVVFFLLSLAHVRLAVPLYARKLEQVAYGDESIHNTLRKSLIINRIFI